MGNSDQFAKSVHEDGPDSKVASYTFVGNGPLSVDAKREVTD